MNKTALTIIVGLVAIAALVLAMYVVRNMSYNDPHQTRLYCFENSSEESDVLRSALNDVARNNNLSMLDRSNEITSDLEKLDRPKPAKVLHGVMQRGSEVVLSYSNLGSNERVFHVSFYSKDFENISKNIDQAIQQVTRPLRAKVIAGGAFDDTFCAE